jgi:thioredoxin reductase (NADPH)
VAEATGVRTDAKGYILSGPDLLERGARPEGWPLDRDPLALETSAPGLFVAGDLRHGSTKRVAGAVGEGSMAVALAHRRIAELSAAG